MSPPTLPYSSGGLLLPPLVELLPPPEVDIGRFLRQWPQIKADATSENSVMIADAIKRLETLLAESEPPQIECIVDEVIIEEKVIEEILALAAVPSEDNSDMQVVSASVISYMTPLVADQLCERELIPTLIAMVQNGDDHLQLMAVWNLALVASWSDDLRLQIIELGQVEVVIDLTLKPELAGDVALFLQNLCLTALNFDKNLAKLMLATAAAIVVESDDPQVVEAGCWTLELFLKRGDDDVIAIVAIEGLVDRLIHILRHGPLETQFPSLRTLANLMLGPARQCQVVVDAGVIPELGILLHHPNPVMRKDSCWAVSNVCGGTKPQIQKVIDNGIFLSLAGLLIFGEYATKQAALWAVANVVMGTEALDHLLLTILSRQLIRGVVRLLRVDEDDGSLAIEALEVVAQIVTRVPLIKPLVSEEGLAYLEECQGEGEVKHLRRKAAKVIATLTS